MCQKCGYMHKKFKNGKVHKTCSRGKTGKGLRSMMKQQKKYGAQRKKDKAELARYRKQAGKGAAADFVNKNLLKYSIKLGKYVWRQAGKKNAREKAAKKKMNKGFKGFHNR